MFISEPASFLRPAFGGDRNAQLRRYLSSLIYNFLVNDCYMAAFQSTTILKKNNLKN